MKIRQYTMLWIGLVAVGFGCGSDGDGNGAVGSDAALAGFMQAVAVDFAQVLADAAPSFAALTEKGVAGNEASCPEGGTAAWQESQFGNGILDLNACTIRGFELNGSLSGFLFSEPGLSVSGDMLMGPLDVGGTSLTVQQLTVSSTFPITEESTFWQISALTGEGDSICAWSGGSGCGPSQF